MNAPIALFAFRRPDHTARLVRTLLANPEAHDSQVVAFCDGARNDADVPLVEQTRRALAAAGIPKLELVERPRNMGLAANVIDGVTRLTAEHGRVIVLEDDLVLSRTFLRYMNEALDRYADEPRVFHVSGFMYPVALPDGVCDAHFLPLASSWGWATWARAWKHFDPAPGRSSPVLTDRAMRRRFDLDGRYGMSRMLRQYLDGRNDSWAIRWNVSVFLQGGLALFPHRSLVENDGFELDATHCAGPRPDYASSTAGDFEVRRFPPIELDQDALDAVKDALGAESTLLARGLRRLRLYSDRATRRWRRPARGTGP